MLNPWRLALLRQLDALGTVRAVAAQAHQSPSSVSAQLAVLEREVGVQLFERAGRRILLTPAGTTLARRAAEVLDHIASVEHEMTDLGSEPVGHVRLAAFASAMPGIVVPAARRLRDTHPLIELEIHDQEPHESLLSLRSGTADVIVTANLGEAPLHSDPTYVRASLGSDSIVLVTAGDRTDVGPTLPDLSSLHAESWSTEAAGTYIADLTVRLCGDSGIDPRITARFSSHHALLAHVEAGLSVTLLPRLAVDDRYDVRVVALESSPTRSIQAVARRSSLQRTAVQVVVDELRTTAGATAAARARH